MQIENNRPKIKLKLTTTDKIVEILGWIAIVATWVLALTSYPTLPDEVPIHYNITEQADSFGAKSSLMMLPKIATVLFLLMSLLTFFPEMGNYHVRITKDNAPYQYTNAVRLLRYIKPALACYLDLSYL